MEADFPLELEHKLHRGDGYRSKPMWSQKDNMSTYYDYDIDRQCMFSGSSLKELMQKLELE